MVRPKAKELTSRELAVMQLFWQEDRATVEDAREHVEKSGESLAYVTVANVVRALADKSFLKQVNDVRPYQYKAVRSFDDVSKGLVGDLVKRLFSGSRKAMLVQLLDQKKLTEAERKYLTDVLNREDES